MMIDDDSIVYEDLPDYSDFGLTAGEVAEIEVYHNLEELFQSSKKRMEETGNNYLSPEMSRYIAYSIATSSMIKTPVDTGNLLRSLYVEKYDTGYVVGYDAPYAVYVHEISYYRHKLPAQAKFLEDSVFDVMASFPLYTLPITIEYDPLRVYIGVFNAPGTNVMSIATGAAPDVKHYKVKYGSSAARRLARVTKEREQMFKDSPRLPIIDFEMYKNLDWAWINLREKLVKEGIMTKEQAFHRRKARKK